MAEDEKPEEPEEHWLDTVARDEWGLNVPKPPPRKTFTEADFDISDPDRVKQSGRKSIETLARAQDRQAEGGRAHNLWPRAEMAYRIAAGSGIEADYVTARFTEAAYRCGMDTDVENNGMRNVELQLRRAFDQSVRNGKLPPAQFASEVAKLLPQFDPETAADLEAQLFDRRDTLKHIREFARARGVSPWSTLGVVLVWASCMVPPNVVLPPIIGGPASLNLFAALVGPPGSGKGGSESAGRDAVKWNVQDLPPVLPLGSGEGVARVFNHGSDGSIIATAIFTASEIDRITALTGRQGSTLESILRNMWMGEELGFTNAQKATTTRVPRLSYRAGLIVGVQPQRASALLDGADGGTPQRFIWLPVLDPAILDTAPEPPQPMPVTPPTFGTMLTRPGGLERLEIPAVARDAIWAHHRALHRGEGVDPLDGHVQLARLKVAAALMVLDGRSAVSDEDWELAGLVIEVSNRTRQAVLDQVAARAREDNEARADAAAYREVRKIERIAESAHERAKKRVLSKLQASGPCKRLDLRRACRSDVRHAFDAALDELVTAGQLVVIAQDGGRADVYDLA